MNLLKNFLREYRIVIALLLVFLILRIPGLSLPYHQDEWKNVSSSSSIESAGAFFAHPPLMQMSFVVGYSILGANNFRVLPLLFSMISAILLFIVVQRRAGRSSALWSLALFVVCFYNILGSLQPDVDGSIVPLFLLLAVYFYDKKWLIPLIISCLIGLLFKLSFIIVIGAIVADYLLNNWRDRNIKSSILGIVGIVGFGLLYTGALYLTKVFYPAFSIDLMFGHANQFAEGLGRNYLQIVVQGIKAVYYLSPLLIVPLLFTSKETFKKTRIFFLYLIWGAIFYFILFDFSRGALDKYLMFAIVPLSIIVGINISELIIKVRGHISKSIVVGGILSALLILLNFLPQTVAALYPKTEWFSRVLHGHWNVLTPLTGGSGPTGFYVSFMFIAVSYVICLVLGITGIFKKEWRPSIAVILVMIGISYNAVFAEELLFGKINGNVATVINQTAKYIQGQDSIKQVMSFNDIGNRELSAIGKYAARFYATPDFEIGHKDKFAEFTGQYMVIDIPHLYEDGFYGKFFAQCKVLFETSSGKIPGRVYDCLNAKKIIATYSKYE